MFGVHLRVRFLFILISFGYIAPIAHAGPGSGSSSGSSSTMEGLLCEAAARDGILIQQDSTGVRIGLDEVYWRAKLRKALRQSSQELSQIYLDFIAAYEFLGSPGTREGTPPELHRLFRYAFDLGETAFGTLDEEIQQISPRGSLLVNHEKLTQISKRLALSLIASPVSEVPPAELEETRRLLDFVQLYRAQVDPRRGFPFSLANEFVLPGRSTEVSLAFADNGRVLKILRDRLLVTVKLNAYGILSEEELAAFPATGHEAGDEKGLRLRRDGQTFSIDAVAGSAYYRYLIDPRSPRFYRMYSGQLGTRIEFSELHRELDGARNALIFAGMQDEKFSNVELSPDGQRMVLVSRNGFSWISSNHEDFKDQEQGLKWFQIDPSQTSLRDHPAISFSGDGKIAAIHQAGRVAVVDFSKNAVVSRFELSVHFRMEHWVRTEILCLSSDRILLWDAQSSDAASGKLTLWNPKSGDLIQEFDPKRDLKGKRIKAVTASADGLSVAVILANSSRGSDLVRVFRVE